MTSISGIFSHLFAVKRRQNIFKPHFISGSEQKIGMHFSMNRGIIVFNTSIILIIKEQ